VNEEIIFRLLFWLLMAGLLAMRVYFMVQVRRAGERLLPDHKAVEREGRGLFILRVALFCILIAFLVSYALYLPWIAALSFPLPGWLRWAGFLLGVTSLGFWTWTQIALGTAWSAQLQLRQEHHLVTHGPYSRIRHPLYTSMVGIGVSFSLVTANWCFVGFTVLVILGLIGRVPKEEQMMLEEFGEEYREYMLRTGRYFPRWKERPYTEKEAK
jgi:protein-S-isoprenylcysteine O-methyltransferase Ste14